MGKFVEIKGARIHNLKNIDVKIPKNKLTVITGVSGSGKSTLAFDTLYEEGKKRYLMFSGTQFMIDTEQGFDSIVGLSPTVAVEQRIIRQSNPRSTVGTRTKLSNMLSIYYAAYGNSNNEANPGLNLSMEIFLKNSPKGMCVKCLGTGTINKLDEEKLFNDQSLAIDELVFGLGKRGRTNNMLQAFCKFHNLSIDQKIGTIPEELLLYLKYGDGGQTKFPGYIPWILQALVNQNGGLKPFLIKNGCLEVVTCPRCNGEGIGENAQNTKIMSKSITELEKMYISELIAFLKTHMVSLSGKNLINEILKKLECLDDVGLSHLSLSRTVPTLSGGEIQRLFLASFIINEMDSIIFIFDEPTIGLHEIEKAKLINIIKKLVDRGNTVVVVEHDVNFMKIADYIIDIGPDAGILGGNLVFQGTYNEFLDCQNSKTASYLSGIKKFIKTDACKKIDRNNVLQINNANLHNLKNIDVEIPLGVIVGIAGVSGSGKSSLIADTLVLKLKELLKRKFIQDKSDDEEGEFEYTETNTAIIRGYEGIAKCIVVDQKPIGRSKNSCPATYAGILDKIRNLLAKTEKALENDVSKSIFSVNSQGGCKVCRGEGSVYFHVGCGNFVEMECSACNGTGFIEEALNINLKDKNIRQILEMTVIEAADFFKELDDSIFKILKTLINVGLGYIKLGQKTSTVSGGESQRIKLAKELGKRQSKNTLYILDEPTTGLAFADRQKLIILLKELCNKGNSIIITEHDPVILRNCDYIIELGPGGGNDGGFIIENGTPLELRDSDKSIIGRYLYDI